MANRYFSNLLGIPRTLQVVADAWLSAERVLQNEVRQADPYAGEEFITERFGNLLTLQLKEASADKHIERAFLRDLEFAFPDIEAKQVLPKVAHGLGATLSRHKRSVETKTGGDLGFATIRPNITKSLSVLTPGLYRRGLLAQAKLRQIDTGKWDELTTTQKNVLPKHVTI